MLHAPWYWHRLVISVPKRSALHILQGSRYVAFRRRCKTVFDWTFPEIIWVRPLYSFENYWERAFDFSGHLSCSSFSTFCFLILSQTIRHLILYFQWWVSWIGYIGQCCFHRHLQLDVFASIEYWHKHILLICTLRTRFWGLDELGMINASISTRALSIRILKSYLSWSFMQSSTLGVCWLPPGWPLYCMA